MAHFEVFKDKAGLYRYRVRAENGEVVAQSEAYESKANAKRGVEDLLEALETKRFDIVVEDDA